MINLTFVIMLIESIIFGAILFTVSDAFVNIVGVIGFAVEMATLLFSVLIKHRTHKLASSNEKDNKGKTE
jgi:hypothetical protein